jgi:hypothetical protein
VRRVGRHSGLPYVEGRNPSQPPFIKGRSLGREREELKLIHSPPFPAGASMDEHKGWQDALGFVELREGA